jgi:NADH-quinone oxidoreductase subunit N
MRWLNAVTALLPVATVAGGALLLLLHDAIVGTAGPAPDDAEGLLRVRLRSALRSAFAVGVLLLAAASSVVLWFLVRRAGVQAPGRLDEIVRLTGGLGGDRFALMVFVILAIGGTLVLLQAGSYLRELAIDRPEFPVLVLLAVLGGMFLAAGRDLLMIFIGLETLSLGTYALTAWQRGSLKSTEAALKNFLLGSFAAAILLFGMALLYGATGSLQLAAIGRALGPGDLAAAEPLAAIGMALVVVGLAFKVSAVPFHMWTPDAYEGANTPTSAFMAVVVKTAAFAVLARLLLVAFPLGSPLSASPAGWVGILTALSVLTMILGNFAALAQRNVKRLLAYSSIAHAGYLLVGIVAAGAASGSSPAEAFRLRNEALSAVLFYLLAYTVATAGAFAAVSIAARRGREASTIEDFQGLSARSPAVSAAFAICILSLLGIPPFAGFFGKFYLFQLAVRADLVPLAVVGLLTSAVAAFYYLRLLVAVYMREPESEDHAVPVPTYRGALGLAFAALAVVALGILPGRVLSVALQSAVDIFRP